MEFGNALPYDIKISGSANKGFIVKAGCCISVFADKKELLKSLEEYIDDPKGMEKKYNNSNQGPQVTEAEAPPTTGRALRGPDLHRTEEASGNDQCESEEMR